MIYRTPRLAQADLSAVAAIEELRVQLRFYLREPRRWYGTHLPPPPPPPPPLPPPLPPLRFTLAC